MGALAVGAVGGAEAVDGCELVDCGPADADVAGAGVAEGVDEAVVEGAAPPGAGTGVSGTGVSTRDSRIQNVVAARYIVSGQTKRLRMFWLVRNRRNGASAALGADNGARRPLYQLSHRAVAPLTANYHINLDETVHV